MSEFYLCCAKTLESQIEELGKCGKKGRNAAEQCRTILKEIRQEGLSANTLTSKRTRRGEARVEKCVKYDLGHGYRLITIMNRDHLFIPFAGTHDKADLWLEHKRLDDIWKRRHSYFIEKVGPDGQNVEQSQSQTCVTREEYGDEYEENLLRRIDDNMLRQVFRGLAESR